MRGTPFVYRRQTEVAKPSAIRFLIDGKPRRSKRHSLVDGMWSSNYRLRGTPFACQRQPKVKTSFEGLPSLIGSKPRSRRCVLIDGMWSSNHIPFMRDTVRLSRSKHHSRGTVRLLMAKQDRNTIRLPSTCGGLNTIIKGLRLPIEGKPRSKHHS